MKLFQNILIIILITIIVIPAHTFLFANTAHAALATFETNPALVGSEPIVAAKTTFSALKDMLIEIHSATTAFATYSTMITQDYLMPLAFLMSGNLLKMMTAAAIAFVAGAINGTGAPQFVQNLQGHLQIVGDTKAHAFLIQFSRNSNSPFAASITSSLRTNYLQQTSMAGFFSANRNTLPRYSSNPNAFLAGNWSQGGIGAWLALTTQEQNNPYLLNQNAKNALASVVEGAVAAREQMLAWGQGMLSWCDEGAEKDTTVGDNGIPKVACVDSETGEDRPIRTPGSTIKSYLDRALGSDFGKLENVGQLGKEVGGILGDVAKVMANVGVVQQILGGSSGGLSGSMQSGPGGSSLLLQYKNSPGYLGAAPTQVYQSMASQVATGGSKLEIITQYETAWNSIRATAVAASTTVQRLATVCATNAANPQAVSNGLDIDTASFASASATQAAAARTSLAGQIASVLSQASAASADVAAARAMITKAQSELSSGDQALQNQGTADMATLQTMKPTASDLGRATQEAQSYGAYGTTASPAGSLTVTGGSLIDQMSLISTNAQTLLTTVCAPETYFLVSNSQNSND